MFCLYAVVPLTKPYDLIIIDLVQVKSFRDTPRYSMCILFAALDGDDAVGSGRLCAGPNEMIPVLSYTRPKEFLPFYVDHRLSCGCG